MKKYFFGYLFVRIAKLLALTIVVIGVAYAIFQVAQANVAAESARYQPNTSLRQQLENLTAKLFDARGLVSKFTNEKLKPEVSSHSFPGNIGANEDFVKIAEALQAIDLERQELKHSVVERFEFLIGEIQNKLRAHAASLSPLKAAPPVITARTPQPTSTPQTAPPRYKAETLFSYLSADDIETRVSTLDKKKQFLKALESIAEDSGNRSQLSESINQLDALQTLLPSKIEVPIQLPAWGTQIPQAPVSEQRKVFNAEKVADQLEQVRSLVRQAVLTSWALDDAFDRSSELALSEQNKCRSATLAVKGIWLSTFGLIGTGAVAAAFVAFLILVMADLTQTLLDTATNTGVIAENSRPQ
jgi:hypothetical protein